MHTKKQRKITVIASHASSLSDLPNLVFASYSCEACNRKTKTVAGSEPFCPHCGSDEVAEVDQDNVVVDMSEFDEKEFSSLTCPNCHVSNIVPDVDLASTGGKIGCVTCGQALDFDVEQLSAADEEFVDEDFVDEDDDTYFSDEDLGEMDEEDGEFATTKSHSTILSNLDRAILLASSDEDEDEEDEEDEDEEDEDSEDDDSEDDEDEDEEIDEDDEVEESSVVQSKRSRSEQRPSRVTASLLDLVLASFPVPLGEELASDEDDYAVDFVPYGDEEIMAMVNGTHVATLKKSSCKANQDIFGSDEYMDALATAFEDLGLEETLSSYGFELSTLDLDDTVLDNYVEARASKEHKAEMASLKANFACDMQQSLELAATGLSRGIFAQHSHAVKQRLVQDLTAANVRDAQHVVDKAFAATEDDYVGTLMAIAQNLIEKSPEVRNQLAETIASLRPQISQASPETTLRETVEASLASPMIPAIGGHKQTTVATASGSIVRNATKGRGLFSSRR